MRGLRNLMFVIVAARLPCSRCPPQARRWSSRPGPGAWESRRASRRRRVRQEVQRRGEVRAAAEHAARYRQAARAGSQSHHRHRLLDQRRPRAGGVREPAGARSTSRRRPGLAALPAKFVHKNYLEVMNILFGLVYRKDLAPFELTKWSDLADPAPQRQAWRSHRAIRRRPLAHHGGARQRRQREQHGTRHSRS